MISTQVDTKTTDHIDYKQNKQINQDQYQNILEPQPYKFPINKKMTRTNHRWPAILETLRSCDNPVLALSIIEVESNFINQRAKTEDSIGLMQIRPSTAKGLDCLAKSDTQLMNIHFNIRCGCRYLRVLKNRYSNIRDQIAAYNAGSVKKCYTGILYPSGNSCPIGGYINQSYVDKVMSIMENKYGTANRIVEREWNRMFYTLQ
jgi:soluble lytic murein transglycosylase-like protein